MKRIHSSLSQQLVVLGVLLFCGGHTFAQSGSRTWTGAVSTDFYDGDNWSATGDFPNGFAYFNDSSLSGAANTTVDRSLGTYNYLYGVLFQNTLDAQNTYTIQNGTRLTIVFLS